jgi:hypothetical protein
MFFFPLPEGDCSVLEAQKTDFPSRFGMSFFGVLFLSELGICLQNFMFQKGVEP